MGGTLRKPGRVSHHRPPVPGFAPQPSTVPLSTGGHAFPHLGDEDEPSPMATPSSTPAAPAAAASVSRLSLLRPSLHRLRLCPAPSAAAAAASPISLRPGWRPSPSIRCRAAAGPSPPSSEPPPPPSGKHVVSYSFLLPFLQLFISNWLRIVLL